MKKKTVQPAANRGVEEEADLVRCCYRVWCFFPILASIFTLSYLLLSPSCYEPIYPLDWTFDQNGRRIHRISFFGDSLILFPDEGYQFIRHILEKLGADYPGIAFDAFDKGNGGDQIRHLYKRVSNDVLQYSPDAIVMYWDSDATDISNPDSPELVTNYVTTLDAVVQALVATTPASRVAVAGPNLFGELPVGRNGRDQILMRYEGINEHITSKYGATFLRMREAFLAALPSDYDKQSGYLTLDGEHPNQRGSYIEEHVFYTWLKQVYAPFAGCIFKAHDRCYGVNGLSPWLPNQKSNKTYNLPEVINS